MKIQCLATGSSGNCYIVHQEGFTYLLDAGVDIRKITANINLNDVDFAFVSHEHKDHSKSLENLVKRGLQVIYGKLINTFVKMPLKSQKAPNIKIYTFPIKHGKCPNSALVVQTANECLLYATDFNSCAYDLRQFKFTKIMVECNFLDDLMAQAPKDEKHLRQINTHMSFNGLKYFLENRINLDSVEEIYLIHLSTEAELIDKEILALKSQQVFKKRIGICLQRGGVDFYGG